MFHRNKTNRSKCPYIYHRVSQSVAYEITKQIKPSQSITSSWASSSHVLLPELASRPSALHTHAKLQLCYSKGNHTQLLSMSRRLKHHIMLTVAPCNQSTLLLHPLFTCPLQLTKQERGSDLDSSYQIDSDSRASFIILKSFFVSQINLSSI